MYLNLYLFVGQVYVIYIITKCQGYVLVAANLKDFKSLARKFVPDKLADQLADLAQETSFRKDNVYEQPFYPRDIYQDAYSEIQNRVKEDSASPNFNFDELVEKVKERLKQELIQKQRMKEARESQVQINPQNDEKETEEDEEDYEIAESARQKIQRDSQRQQRPPQQREQHGPQKYKQETDEYDEEEKTSSTRQKMQVELQIEQRPPQQREQRSPQNKYKQETDEYDEEDKTSSTRQKMQRERRPQQHRDQLSSQNKNKQENNEYDEDYKTTPSIRQKLQRYPQREQRPSQQREQGSQNKYKQETEDYDEAYKPPQPTRQKLQRGPQREHRLSQQREQRGPQNKYKQETDEEDEDYKTPQSIKQKMQREPQRGQRPQHIDQQREAPQLEMEFEEDDGRHEDTEQEDMKDETPQIYELKPYREQTRFEKQKKQHRGQQKTGTGKNPDKYATVEYEADPADENNNNEGLKPKDNNDMSFAKMKLTKNDSYEDYVFPTKEKNVYESDHERIRVRKPVGVIQKFPKSVTYKVKDAYESVIALNGEIPAKPLMPLEPESPKEDNQYIVEIEEEEEKAQTGNLWYDEGAPNAKEDAIDNTTPIDLTTNKKAGTMIPKRDFYKISSPNYYANVPIVAEKYDFNEPIPDKDREPDNMKRLLPLPPSVINGKVKFSK